MAEIEYLTKKGMQEELKAVEEKLRALEEVERQPRYTCELISQSMLQIWLLTFNCMFFSGERDREREGRGAD